MIEVTIVGLVDGPPVVTTSESINEEAVSDAFAPIVAKLIGVAESVSGVRPVAIKLFIAWADGEVKEEKPMPTPLDSSKIPKHWS